MASYSQRFQQLNRRTPTRSRNRKGKYGGSPCPDSISFGRGHGTSPMTASINYSGGAIIAYYGDKLYIRIGSAMFIGIVVFIHQHTDAIEGEFTEIGLVDMRDRLHDVHLHCQINMIDSSGMYYHILPKDWNKQIRTIVREIKEQDFNKKEEKPEIEFACQFGLPSAATIFNDISKTFNFTWSASDIALRIMQFSRPDNLDWNDGVKVIDALQAILEKNGLQMTFWGDLHCHVTLKGWTDNIFLKQMLAANVCNILGYIGDNRGGELNERGRRAKVIGDRNRYENFYAATPNWNKKFTLPVCLGWELAALLEANDLSLRSKLEELPEDWHDPENWNGKPRNKMAIEDYIREICFKCYVVDTVYPIDDPLVTVPEGDGFLTLPAIVEEIDEENGRLTRREVEYEGGHDYRAWVEGNDPFLKDYDSYFPVSDKLVSDSNLQFIAYSSYKNLRVKGHVDPFDFDAEAIIQILDGANLDVETTIDERTCSEKYRVRVIFSEMKYILAVDPEDEDQADKPLAQIKSEISYHGPDYIAVRLVMERELFTYQSGEEPDKEGNNRARVREQIHSVSGLHRNFVNNEEVDLLTLYLQEQDINQFVNAQVVAERIAQQVLFHGFVTESGSMSFDKEAGFQCDGLIDTVAISYNEQNGIEEVITFTSLNNDLQLPFIIDLSVTSKYKDIKQVHEEALHKHRIDIIAANRRIAKQAAGNPDIRQNEIAGNRNWNRRAEVFADNNAIEVKLTMGNLTEQEEFFDGETMLVANPPQFEEEYWDASEDAEDSQLALPNEHVLNYS